MANGRGATYQVFSQFVLTSVFLLLAWASSMICAEGQTVSNRPGQSWTATTVIRNSYPSRITEGHYRSGNKILDKTSGELLSPDGFKPDFYIEKETVRISATTTRSIVRSYSPDGSGRKQLAQVTEEEITNLPNGESNVVRTTSNPDPYGDLHVMQREVIETTKDGPNSQDTKSTVYLPDISHNLAPVRQTDEQQKRGANGSIETTKTTKSADSGNGGWQLDEITKQVVREDGETRTTEDRISRPDSEGNLSQVSRIVVKDTQINGQNVETAETYSDYVPGSTRDGRLHLIQRVTTVQSRNPGRTTTEQQVERINPYGLHGDMIVMTKTSDVVTSGPAGAERTKTTRVWNPDGGFSVISVETTKSDQPPVIELQTSSSERHK